MGCEFEVFAYGEDAMNLRPAVEAAIEEILRVESLLSHYLPDSEICYLNAHASAQPVRVHPEVFELIARAIEISRDTQGAFDITLMPLIRCWGFFTGVGKIPDESALSDVLQCIGAHHIIIDHVSLTIGFAREGVQVHLGAVGKGYAVDKAIEVLRGAGVNAALVHGGHSSVRAYGELPNTGGWQLNLPHPLIPERSLGHLLLRDKAISTSSLTEQFFERNGKRYGHILDPRTGKPAENNVLSVTVIADEATVSDALSTAFFVLGTEGAQAYIRRHHGVQALILRHHETEAEWIT